jgi:hypothetical protein
MTLSAFGDNVVGIRMAAVIVGMLFLALSYAVARGFLGRVAALAALSGLSVSWWAIIYGRIGVRALTFPTVLLAAVYVLGQALRTRALWRYGVAGGLFGLCFYTYTAASVVPLLLGASLLYATLFQRRALRRHRQGGLLLLLALVLVAAPLFVYLRLHPELVERVTQLNEPLTALREGDPRPLWRGMRATMGMFTVASEGRWTYGLPHRPLFEPIGGLLFLGGLFLCLRRLRRPVCGLLCIWLAVALLPSVVTPDAPSTIRAIGALPAVYGLLAVAVAWLWQRARRWRWPARAPVALGLMALLLANAAWTYRDGFCVWASHPNVYWLYKSHFADIAAFLDQGPDRLPLVVVEGWVDPVDVRGLRRDLVHDERAPRWVQAGHSFLWPADADHFTLAVPIYSSLDAEVWRRLAQEPPVSAVSSNRMADGRPGVTFYAIDATLVSSRLLEQASAAPVTLPEVEESVPLPLDFQEEYRFLGYEVLSSTGDGALRVVTYWRALREAPVPVKVFIHLLDSRGGVVGQHDGFDVWTPSLEAGDRLAQVHEIPLPQTVAPGAYQLQMGVYRQADQVRLNIRSGDREIGDRVWLQRVEVAQ